jgi:hypothetical protein
MYRVTYSDFTPARSASEWMLRDHSLALFEVAHFSRVAATAHSRGRQPTEQDENKHVSREAAAAKMIAVAASRLEFLRTFFCGLTPAAIGYRRFATQNYATS